MKFISSIMAMLCSCVVYAGGLPQVDKEYGFLTKAEKDTVRLKIFRKFKADEITLIELNLKKNALGNYVVSEKGFCLFLDFNDHKINIEKSELGFLLEINLINLKNPNLSRLILISHSGDCNFSFSNNDQNIKKISIPDPGKIDPEFFKRIQEAAKKTAEEQRGKKNIPSIQR